MGIESAISSKLSDLDFRFKFAKQGRHLYLSNNKVMRQKLPMTGMTMPRILKRETKRKCGLINAFHTENLRLLNFML